MMCSIILNATRYRERKKGCFNLHPFTLFLLKEPDFEEDEYIYDDLNLEAEEALYNVRTEDQLTPSVEGRLSFCPLKQCLTFY